MIFILTYYNIDCLISDILRFSGISEVFSTSVNFSAKKIALAEKIWNIVIAESFKSSIANWLLFLSSYKLLQRKTNK